MRCAHHAHGHTDKATGDPEVGMLAGGFTTAEVIFKIFRAITADVECRLHHEIFEKMVASFADAAGYRWPLTAASLFDLRYDAGTAVPAYG